MSLGNKILSKINKAVVRKSTLEDLSTSSITLECMKPKLELINTIVKHKLIENVLSSKSQLGQDLFVLSELEFKQNGYFVEFGATNGFNFSNTYLLEKQFNWKGIVAEPAKKWHTDLYKNRDCIIETECVWKVSGEKLSFNEAEIGELSTINSFSSKDTLSRKKGIIYDVTTISLLDLLEKNEAPYLIDYLSIDTEGSELAILENFDFNKYKFRVITCEHNFTADREKIYQLLTKYGYKRKFEDISKFDDWYILQ